MNLKLLLPLFFLYSGQLLAEEVTAKIPAVDPVSSTYLLKLILGLVFILILIFGLAWFMKKMQLTQHSQNGVIKIVSAISVGQRDRIALIQVGEEQLLLGITPGRIEKLHSLQKPVQIVESNQSVESFKDKFNQIMNRSNNNAS